MQIVYIFWALFLQSKNKGKNSFMCLKNSLNTILLKTLSVSHRVHTLGRVCLPWVGCLHVFSLWLASDKDTLGVILQCRHIFASYRTQRTGEEPPWSWSNKSWMCLLKSTLQPCLHCKQRNRFRSTVISMKTGKKVFMVTSCQWMGLSVCNNIF